MGLANLVPGISGGTMLLASGVYTAFIAAIAEVTTLRFRTRSLVLLGTIVATAALAILLNQGIGDTIRVSLTPEPGATREREVQLPGAGVVSTTHRDDMSRGRRGPERRGEARVTGDAVEGVADIDLCRVRKSGLGLFVDIHVVVDGSLSVDQGHAIAHRVKDALVHSDLTILDVVVHIEPLERE